MAERKHSGGGSTGMSASSVTGTGKEMLQDAQKRVQKAFRGDREEDVILKSVLGAVAATLAIRAIRQTPLGAIVMRVVPMIAFIGLYDRYSRAAR